MTNNAANNSSYWRKTFTRLAAFGLPESVIEHAEKDNLQVVMNAEVFEAGQDDEGFVNFELTELIRIKVYEEGLMIFSYFGHADPARS